MEQSKERPAANGRWQWQGEMTIQRVVELRQELMQALERTDRLLIDLSEVTEIDPACLQLLCSGHRTATALNKELTLLGSGRLGETLRHTGFVRHVGCAQDCNHSCLWVEEQAESNEKDKR